MPRPGKHIIGPWSRDACGEPFPETQWIYCPWWVQGFDTVEQMKGSLSIWQAWECECYPGLPAIISQMASALSTARYHAQRRYFEDTQT